MRQIGSVSPKGPNFPHSSAQTIFILALLNINPIWTGLFQTQRPGGGSPPNLPFSTQMMMNLGRNILREIYYAKMYNQHFMGGMDDKTV